MSDNDELDKLNELALKAYDKKDFVEAFRCFERLAEQGDVDGQYNLGTMYLNGRGTERNIKKAAELFLAAAEKHDPQAQYHLAVIYYFGEEQLEKLYDAVWQRQYESIDEYICSFSRLADSIFTGGNFLEAMKSYTEAAEGGYASAQNNLGRMYVLGHGGHDPAQGYGWICIAAKNGCKWAPANIQVLDQELSKPQRGWGKKWAEENFAKYKQKQEYDWEKRADFHRSTGAEEDASPKEYWLNTNSNTRHNSRCTYYRNTRMGRDCGANEGIPCVKCGG